MMNSRKSATYETKAKMDPIVFPKKWKVFTPKEQMEWIKEYFMLKKKIPEPVLRRNEKIAKGTIKLESGSTLKFPVKIAAASKPNPNLVREYEGWVGKWLITVFHDKSFPPVKYFGIANPSGRKWIAQELSSQICNEFYAILLQIRWKYGLFKGKRRKKPNKSSISTLSLKDSSIGEGSS